VLGQRDQIGDFVTGQDTIDLTAFSGAAVTLVAAGAGSIVQVDIFNDGLIDMALRVNSTVAMGDLLL
jgi:23S rRNA G2069 N7-methylase RlmK/C1962 C5-methylase RlmI